MTNGLAPHQKYAPRPHVERSRRTIDARRRVRRMASATTLLVEARAGQPLQRLAVLLLRPLDHDGGQMRSGRRLVPVERLEIVAHVLLVEALRRRAGLVAVGGPEARRVR